LQVAVSLVIHLKLSSRRVAELSVIASDIMSSAVRESASPITTRLWRRAQLGPRSRVSAGSPPASLPDYFGAQQDADACCDKTTCCGGQHAA